ncbi:DUF4293 domain-containing protein [Pedobacter sp. L105]|uniref:DUF4293 domain-containing protein n=1 Tax=Pedobacter sp. L105 TaxID=1641871 RepID=UPI00131BEF4C|nr:DUF4293 domain-containing protein [Pedobacter sp. L105]
MIQRVQSIWLFLAGLTLFLLLILPVLTKHNYTGDLTLQVGGIYQKGAKITQKMETYTTLFGETILIGVICVANIFAFRNRTLQKRITLFTIVLLIQLAVWIGFYVENFPGGMDGTTFGAGAYLPVLAIIFCALAFRGIRKDEQLIRSADRLR